MTSQQALVSPARSPRGPQLYGVTALAQLTTMRVGGGFERLSVCESRADLIVAAKRNWHEDLPWLLLGGGSNTVVSDEGFPGEVVLVRNTGIELLYDPDTPPGMVRVRAEAGHEWDELVQWTVSQGYAGIEMLSGIPGLVGAAPVQNIGAYGGELSNVLYSVTVYDRCLDEVRQLSAAELQLSYRDSLLKQGYEAVVLAVDLLLRDHSGQEDPLSTPIVYPQLAGVLGVKLGAAVSLAAVREAVLGVRAAKGMVWQMHDQNSWSAGSFFTNPIVSARFARELPATAPRFPVVAQSCAPPLVTPLAELAAGGDPQLHFLTDSAQGAGLPGAGERQFKLSAAWLIEHSGVPRGFALPGSGAAVSQLHTLALTNTGTATAADIAELARYIISMVQVEFGVVLTPEPRLYGLQV